MDFLRKIMSRSGPHLQRRSITRFQTTRTLYAPAGCSFPQLQTQEREEWFWLALEAPCNLNLGQHLTEVSSSKIRSSDALEDNIVKEMTESIEIVSSEGIAMISLFFLYFSLYRSVPLLPLHSAPSPTHDPPIFQYFVDRRRALRISVPPC